MNSIVNDFSTTLLHWFDINGRSLPWRGTKNPYAIWLSEIILQQTRIQQGWKYWENFMRQWPTVEELADATEDEVLRLWQGLGYYSRARNLHHAAKQIVRRGGFPTTYEDLRELKGVGDYTAAAIASIAYDLPVAVVDGNVYRVLARYYGLATPINTSKGKKEFTTLAQSLLPANAASRYNQAIMDFGAIQCTPHNPQCNNCPLQETCMAWNEGKVSELPVKLKKLQIKQRKLIYVYIRHEGYTAIHRRGGGDIWQGLWEPLLIEGESPKTDIPWNECFLLAKEFKHVLTHRVLLADLYLWEPVQRPSLTDGYIWVREEDLDNYAIPRLVELLLEKTSGMLEHR